MASLALPSHKLSPCLWPTPCLLIASVWRLFFLPFTPVPSLRALAYFCPIASVAVPVACMCMCSSGEHGFDIHPTGGFVQWSLVLVQWMMDWLTGGWWMMLVLPSWYCVCSRYCDIPWSLSELSLVHFPLWLSLYFVAFFSTFYWHLKLCDSLDSVAV